MNDYVPKPINRDRLFEALHDNLPVAPKAESRAAAAAGDSAVEEQSVAIPGLDAAAGIARLGGSRSGYIEVVAEFCRYGDHFYADFLEAIQQQDFHRSRELVHTLKGAAGNVSAVDIHRSALLLESACKTRDMTQMNSIVEIVRKAFNTVSQSCQTMMEAHYGNGKDTNEPNRPPGS
jgi:two-component system sensor histidine kinase/response regulator